MPSELDNTTTSKRSKGWLLERALEVGGLVPIFPGILVGHAKKPQITGWQRLATQDPKKIRAWAPLWEKKGALICMPTGAASGYDVMDPDMKNGQDGLAAVPDWETLTPLRTRTPNGGRHLWFQHDPAHPIASTSDGQIAPGVDTRGEGGYVVVPPSEINGVAYVFEDGGGFIHPVALPTMPAKYRDKVLYTRDDEELDHGQQARDLLAKVCERVAHADAGTVNGTLYRAAKDAGKWVGVDALDRAEVEEALEKAAEELTQRDGIVGTRSTIRSGLEDGIREGRLPDGQAAPVLDPRTPMRTARRLRRLRFAKRPLVRHRATTYRWTGTHWRELSDEKINGVILRFLETAKTLGRNGTLEPYATSKSQVDNIRMALQEVCTLADEFEPGQWIREAEGRPKETELIAVANGIVNMRTGELLDPTPDLFNLYAADYEYDPEAPCEEWLKFLDSVWPSDPQSIETLGQWFGYCLTTDTSQQKICFLYGPSRSGKGTIIRLLTSLVGVPNVAVTSFTALERDLFALASFIGKPVVIMGDVHAPAKVMPTGIERLLSISGGDAQAVNRKFKEQWNGYLYCRFTLATTELPEIMDPSGALANRLLVLALTQSFMGREDTQLDEKLLKERPGILNFAITCWRRLKRFEQPEAGREAADQLRMLNAPMRLFLALYYVDDATGLERKSDFLKLWEAQCADVGGEYRGTAHAGKLLKQTLPGIRAVRRGPAGKQEDHYQGFRRRTAKDDQRDEDSYLKLVP